MVNFRSFWKRFSETFTKSRSRIIISSILIIGAVIILLVLWSAANSSTCKSNPISILTPPDNIGSLKQLLKINIGRLKYSPGQIVDLSGSVFDNTRKNINSTLIIVVNQTGEQSLPWCYLDLPKQRITHFASIPTNKNGNFSYGSLSNQNIGIYNITIYPKDEPQAKYSIPIEVVNPFFTLTAYLLYAGIIFFGSLTVATIIPSKKETMKEFFILFIKPNKDPFVLRILYYNLNLTLYKILRFIFISGMVISILGGLALTDVEVGANSPVGLILQQVLDRDRNPQFDKNNGLPIREWAINIGGNTISNDRSFIISIPFYVVLLGLAGGYLRYLSKAASRQYVRPPEYIKPEENSQEFAVGTQAELSEMALAPLLATVVWLLLSQGQTTTSNTYWLAAVSFSIGLVTREIINGIKRLMTSLSLDTTKQSLK